MNSQIVRTMPVKLVAVAWVLCGAVASQASVIVSYGGSHPYNYYDATVSATDLAETGIANTPTINFTPNDGSSVGYLFNGVMDSPTYASTALTPSGSTGAANSAEAVTINLNLAVAPRGYNLTAVQSYTSWDYPDWFREGQNYNLYYSTVADPSTFLPLASVYQSGYQGGNGAASAVQMTVSDSLGGYIATDVAKLQIDFMPTDFADGSFYREFDLLGQAVIPEPSTVLLLLGGGWLLCWRGRQ